MRPFLIAILNVGGQLFFLPVQSVGIKSHVHPTEFCGIFVDGDLFEIFVTRNFFCSTLHFCYL